jgi:hypothetical protein
MKLIRCECGEKILLLPELKKMNEAIEKHVAQHRTIWLTQGHSKAKILSEGAHLRHVLSQQVLVAVVGELPRYKKRKH